MELLPAIVQLFSEPVFGIIIIIAAFAIGTTQGHILGKAIHLKFPRIQNNAKKVSVGLFFLFLINAILSVPRFASPEKIDVSKIFQATSPSDVASIIFTIFGVNTGFLAVLAISVTIMTLLLLRSTKISGIKRVFVVFFSLLILAVTGISRFTDYTPTNYEVFLYFLYQLGITIGIVVGTARKVKKESKTDYNFK